MKAFITALGAIGAGAIFAVWALVELVARLAPLLIVVGVAWAVFAMLHARRRRIRDDRRLQEQWAQTRRHGAATPRPYAPHYERFYLVVGDDAGFAADRDDGYFNVCTAALPPALAHQPRVPGLRRSRRRATRRRTRP